MPMTDVVSGELSAARAHLQAMVEDLSQDELLWLPPRPDGICISYHAGHIGLVEDLHIAGASQESAVTSAELRAAFGVHNINNRAARFPRWEEILEYLFTVRGRTLALLPLRFQGVRNRTDEIAAAELFRGVIDHEYSHTKYIRRIRAEMGKPSVGPPASELVRADERAVASPQYRLPRWSEPLVR